MSKRGENIHKRIDGRWEGRYRKGFDNYGKPKYGSVYGKTYREAKEKLAAAISGLSVLTPNHCSGKCFGKVLQLWLETNRINLKGATVTRYQNLIRTHIEPALGGMNTIDITATTVNAFLAEKLRAGRINGKGGLSPAYVKSMMLIIKAALKYAADEKLCDPLNSLIYRPVESNKERPVLSRNQQQQLEYHLLQNLDSTTTGILISLRTGLRIGEVCALRWENIDLEEQIIHVRHTIARVRDYKSESNTATKLILDSPKTKSSKRDIPIPSSLLAVLLEEKAKSKSDFIISDNCTFISPRTYEYRYHRVLKECGLEQINYHALRHTFATRCIEAGVDVKTLSEILGHSDVAITLNTYVHSSMDMKRLQMEKLSTCLMR